MEYKLHLYIILCLNLYTTADLNLFYPGHAPTLDRMPLVAILKPVYSIILLAQVKCVSVKYVL